MTPALITSFADLGLGVIIGLVLAWMWSRRAIPNKVPAKVLQVSSVVEDHQHDAQTPIESSTSSSSDEEESCYSSLDCCSTRLGSLRQEELKHDMGPQKTAPPDLKEESQSSITISQLVAMSQHATQVGSFPTLEVVLTTETSKSTLATTSDDNDDDSRSNVSALDLDEELSAIGHDQSDDDDMMDRLVQETVNGIVDTISQQPNVVTGATNKDAMRETITRMIHRMIEQAAAAADDEGSFLDDDEGSSGSDEGSFLLDDEYGDDSTTIDDLMKQGGDVEFDST